MAKLADREPDPENALTLWDEIIELNPENGVYYYARANNSLMLNRWDDALQDYARAIPLLKGNRAGATVVLPAGNPVPIEIIAEALARDGTGLALSQKGDWAGALDSFQRALGTIGLAGISELPVPEGTPFSGLLGSAPTLGQRIELHAALALLGKGDSRGAVSALQRIDKGPSPDGYPQFWDAAAALVAALTSAGMVTEAEMEWANLCRPTPPAPPATPDNPVFARINKAAQTMLDLQGMALDRNCEDFDTGTLLPCDDAGIPGLGGSSSPCALYTVKEVKARRWPEAAVKGLEKFLSISPEESSKNKARGALRSRGQ
eukprot:jgi/Mesvir1/9412/Mv01515-RA.1